MELMEWVPVGAAIGIAIFLFFAYSFFRGVIIIADLRQGKERTVTGAARLYVWAARRRATEIGFYLLFFVFPVFCVFVPGLYSSPAEAIWLMYDNWYVFFGGILLSFTLPLCYAETGEEEQEAISN